MIKILLMAILIHSVCCATGEGASADDIMKGGRSFYRKTGSGQLFPSEMMLSAEDLDADDWVELKR